MLNIYSKVWEVEGSAYTHAHQRNRYSILHNGLCAWKSAKGPSIAQSTATGKKGECVRRRRRRRYK